MSFLSHLIQQHLSLPEKEKIKLQKKFLAACWERDVDIILDCIQKGAEVEFFGDPAYALKAIFEDITPRQLHTIFEAIGGVTPELLAAPHKTASSSEPLFQFVLKLYSEYASILVEHTTDTKVLEIMIVEVNRQLTSIENGVIEREGADYYHNLFDLIANRQKILSDKEVLETAVNKEVPQDFKNSTKSHKI